jgi:hypothetical protein
MLWISHLWLNQHRVQSAVQEIDPPCRLLGSNWLRVALNWCQQANAYFHHRRSVEIRVGDFGDISEIVWLRCFSVRDPCGILLLILDALKALDA